MSAAAVSQICFLQDLKRQIQIEIGSLLHDTQWQVTGGAEKTVQLLLFCVLEVSRVPLFSSTVGFGAPRLREPWIASSISSHPTYVFVHCSW